MLCDLFFYDIYQDTALVPSTENVDLYDDVLTSTTGDDKIDSKPSIPPSYTNSNGPSSRPRNRDKELKFCVGNLTWVSHQF